ncbi:TetR/AcrR family transcriptional regulator [Sphaerospermopsis aphanizomenoides BCCUSP55]|uniref:TetR/AcrR family transcriptional regulator n=1 Tax=Sphaerospermopsis aphanizomenoides TaxID=459663 RepID=UPI000B136D31|nr:TetR/AcrR family transcriptional regulator [Sphaerospermopsis aphanizomenoides]MBK1989774.1 TetR/AcrR family transcriptional regulator [Sphaerospermopsis aphanizomenoides BCCUSP55]
MSRTSPRTTKTRDRLLKAAIEVFSTEGYVGATTREIASLADVSEVTLFRHFQSKEQLLKAVAQHITALLTEVLTHQVEWTHDLYRDLLHYAKLHDQMLEEYEALFRMFIGEAQRHPTEALEVLQQSFLPLREKLIAYLQTCIEKGSVRPDVDLPLAVDQFTGILLSGMIRRHVLLINRGYSREQYIESCVDLLIRGIGTKLAIPSRTLSST